MPRMTISGIASSEADAWLQPFQFPPLDLALEADELSRIRGEADVLLARHTGRTPGQIRADTDRALVLAGSAVVGRPHVAEALAYRAR